MITVLMYHAIPAGMGAEPGADAHYSVPLARFEAQLALMDELGLSPSSVLDCLQPGAAGCVAVTFDDGHVTNFVAAERLQRVGGRADFFVNPSTVGTPGFLDWAQLREMASMGMSIQSHGMHHRFLDELPAPEVRAELADSKRSIEDRLGCAVTVYAPAGGRVVPGLYSIAQGLGYERLCSSRVGLWDGKAPAAIDIPRLAMLAGTGSPQLTRWLRRSPLEMAWQVGRYSALRQAKKLLGNSAYVLLRGRLLRQDAPGQT